MTTEPPFHLLAPEHLPDPGAVLDHVRHSASRVPGRLAFAVVSADAAALAQVRAALAAVPLAAGQPVRLDPDPAQSPGNRDNDQAFGIVRVDGNRPRLLLHAALEGYATLLDDAVRSGTGLTGEQWTRLRGGFAALLGYLCGVEPWLPAGGYRPTPPRAGTSPADALRRWVRGHRLFMVLIQGLVVALNELHGAIEGGPAEGGAVGGDALPAAERALELAVTLMGGSEAALRFAGDFTQEEYDKVVRPTLMPPTAPPGMSGLHWRDHQHLVRQLAAAQPLLANLDPALAPLRARFRRLYAATYDAHRFVCARFVGEERRSLLMTAKTKQSAVGVLSHYKRVRLQHIPE